MWLPAGGCRRAGRAGTLARPYTDLADPAVVGSAAGARPARLPTSNQPRNLNR